MRKRTLSIRLFITELGENFSDHTKQRLMELESMCFLTRKESNYKLDLKHVEHLQYECNSEPKNSNSINRKKEYAYGQFVVNDGILYFSERCFENNDIMQAPIVESIYNSLSSEGMVSDETGNFKMVDDKNIDYVIDEILSVCPQVSKAYTDIINGMVSRANNK
jgi:hypothetical protein